MADKILLNATKGKPKSLNLCNKGLKHVPALIGNITTLKAVDLKNNALIGLPEEFSSLKQLESLNIGNNKLEDFPEVLGFLSGLQRLHLFNNQLNNLSSSVLSKLVSLQFLSVDHNHLSSVPTEICHLINLTELHLADNQISSLPEDMAFLRNLTKLYVHKNFIEELPEGLAKCTQLRVLDVSANRLRIFPAELANLPLKELYCEENNLLQHIPVHSQQEDEVLTLKEISARLVLKELKNGRSFVRRSIRHFPKLQDMLQYSTDCVVCGQSFLNTWLECVHFVDARKVLRTKTRPGIIPVRGLLCSYKCFNTEGHDYFGIAYVGDT
ncbi:Leucine-rich repeat-containing protein 69 [Acropora cervicornis]|uniref:Leucine-rich repeat-containing protein 69 n=1 Tax=Acropora cervicornis TaxID=6130 RepID=A0AAD9PWL8_ACRCE|nr:Leucine-rich repeat-containing protein 69 [Acropora cervicornis]